MLNKLQVKSYNFLKRKKINKKLSYVLIPLAVYLRININK